MKYITPVLLLIIAVALIILIIRINQIRKDIIPVIGNIQNDIIPVIQDFEIPSFFKK